MAEKKKDMQTFERPRHEREGKETLLGNQKVETVRGVACGKKVGTSPPVSVLTCEHVFEKRC